MSQLINMTVPGEPKPWQVWVRMSAPTPGYLEFKAYQQTIQVKCLEAWGTKPLITTGVEIALEFVRSYPKNLPKGEASRERRLKEALVRKPDLDNMVKAAIDGTRFTATLETFKTYGEEIDRGEGKQTVLPLKHWRTLDSKQMTLEL